MLLTNEEKEAMRAATYEAAIALYDDLAFIREAVDKLAPSRTDVRRISGAMRRLLLEEHLTQVAGPRIGALEIPIFDTRAALANTAADFVSVGFTPVYGLSGLHFHTSKDQDAHLTFVTDPWPLRTVRCDGLLADRVARLEGLEISRADILKYICHHDYGVHFTGKDKAAFRAIARFKNTLTFRLNDGTLTITRRDLDRSRPSGALMDLAHVHAFSTAFFVVRAPAVNDLLRVLEAEISSHETPAEDRPNED